MSDAIVKLTVEYPREWDALIDESALRKYAEKAFEFHLVKRPQMESRIRLPEGQAVGSMSPFDLLQLFWDANHVASTEQAELARLARQIIQQTTETDVSTSLSEGLSSATAQEGAGQ